MAFATLNHALKNFFLAYDEPNYSYKRLSAFLWKTQAAKPIRPLQLLNAITVTSKDNLTRDIVQAIKFA